MSKKIENRFNLYFNKSQQDVCEYLNNIEDKSAFVVDLVRKHMHNQEILTSGVSDRLDFIRDSLKQIQDTLNNGVSIVGEIKDCDVEEAEQYEEVESSVSSKKIKVDSSKPSASPTDGWDFE